MCIPSWLFFTVPWALTSRSIWSLSTAAGRLRIWIRLLGLKFSSVRFTSPTTTKQSITQTNTTQHACDNLTASCQRLTTNSLNYYVELTIIRKIQHLNIKGISKQNCITAGKYHVTWPISVSCQSWSQRSVRVSIPFGKVTSLQEATFPPLPFPPSKHSNGTDTLFHIMYF